MQTDEEKMMQLPVLMPMFDRATCSIPKAQIGFVDFIINDMVEAWDGQWCIYVFAQTYFCICAARNSVLFSAFIDMPEMVGYMRQNYEKWKEYNVRNYFILEFYSCFLNCIFLQSLNLIMFKERMKLFFFYQRPKKMKDTVLESLLLTLIPTKSLKIL